MPINKRQHFVSQFTIRQFLAGHDQLYCLDKATLTVTDRIHGNQPSDILNRAYYYTTDTDDFDGEVVKPIEDKLAPLCLGLTTDHEVTAAADSAWASLIDWCALSLTRSIYFAHVAPIAYDTLSDEDKADFPNDTKGMTLVARRATFQRVRAELHNARVMFRFLKSPCDCGYFLTDCPPAPIPYRRIGAIGPMLLPLAHNWMLIQVPMGLATEFLGSMKPTLEWLTLAQCGWAQRLIYSADLAALDFAAWVLSEGSGDYPKMMHERARLPFFGFGEPSELASMWADQPS